MPHKDPQAAYEYNKAYRARTKALRDARRPDQDRARHANRRARKYGVPGLIRVADVRRVLHSDARCVFCGTADRLTIDHVVPMDQGGPNVVENLQPACLSCNISKYRGERPGRWARDHDACLACDSTERPHRARGLCGRCLQREVKRAT